MISLCMKSSGNANLTFARANYKRQRFFTLLSVTTCTYI